MYKRQIRTQFQKLEEHIEGDTRTLRARLEQVEHALKHTTAAYRASLHRTRELAVDLADAVERKQLLSSQFVSFVNPSDGEKCGVAGRRRPLRSDLCALQDKIEAATRVHDALREQLSREQRAQQALRLDLEDAKERKVAASHQLVARMVALSLIHI